MSRATDWRQYPPSFKPLIERAFLETVEVPCADARDAMRLRQRLYAYLGAVHKAAAKDPALIEFDLKTRKVQLRTKDSVLYVRPTDLDPDNDLVAAALGQPTAGDAGAPISPEMRKLIIQPLT